MKVEMRFFKFICYSDYAFENVFPLFSSAPSYFAHAHLAQKRKGKKKKQEERSSLVLAERHHLNLTTRGSVKQIDASTSEPRCK